MAPDDGTTTDERLVALALNGDDGAFARLVARHKGTVYRTASRFARNHHEREDLSQEIFIRAHASLSTFQAKAPFEHWLARIAVRKCLDFLRKRSRAPHEVNFENNPEANQSVASQDADDQAVRATEILLPPLKNSALRSALSLPCLNWSNLAFARLQPQPVGAKAMSRPVPTEPVGVCGKFFRPNRTIATAQDYSHE